MDKKTKNSIIISITAVALVLAGVTYAYFSARLTGLESASTISLTAGRMGIQYSEGDGVAVLAVDIDISFINGMILQYAIVNICIISLVGIIFIPYLTDYLLEQVFKGDHTYTNAVLT